MNYKIRPGSLWMFNCLLYTVIYILPENWRTSNGLINIFPQTSPMIITDKPSVHSSHSDMQTHISYSINNTWGLGLYLLDIKICTGDGLVLSNVALCFYLNTTTYLSILLQTQTQVLYLQWITSIYLYLSK